MENYPESPIGDLVGVSFLAHNGMETRALELLWDPSVLTYGLQTASSTFPLTDSAWQMPESIRRHPRYHEWWARPGYAELAEVRRANGQPYGLPLPVEP